MAAEGWTVEANEAVSLRFGRMSLVFMRACSRSVSAVATSQELQGDKTTTTSKGKGKGKQEDADAGGEGDGAWFHPEFTHQVFGENEVIVGYKNLSVEVRALAKSVARDTYRLVVANKVTFAAGTLLPHVAISYAKKALPKDLEGAQPTDIVKDLKEWLADMVTSSKDEFSRKLDRDAAKFTPVGEKVMSRVLRPRGKATDDG